MRVLVTRPDPGGARTAARLALSGHDPVLMPLFEAEVTATPEDLPPVSRISGLIATSARAFSLFKASNLLDKAILDVPVHVVGPATAEAAQLAGFSDIREGAGAARDLARVLVDSQVRPVSDADKNVPEPERQHLVYLAGVPRTAAIEAALSEAGAAFSVLECYRMVEMSYSTDILISGILSPPPDVVLLYSANAARRLVALLEAKGLGNTLDLARFICLSEAIMTELPAGWRARAIAADHPDEDRLLASLDALG
ncbi:MAG: uroporphyrinogen-III synthase [Hoeflea sp.]|uniref:uroporphyrinogen-III synthase n=1 Tax=Hoeflea sp. TaxID=1940281 RepID=UPI001D6C03C9|nr:uroporphyrinogen-III synthase [Hoeflea sp.]MBU4531847.1 uroporphyrinogen-III synthase [Alphaproteobacteria bacterium]MBU4544703.1 uroporphyrinogen-III synthase [Alphaproteobacteria bacterium]MBU4552934.1 uroporphyrinogen-III synthase [Alphaproteobacteria bacterium]MBV1725123.1 uroporphyrinogen-III synthase [Hoeflea sp.]MBV1761143.1 uroporphyrinogen-III synthase [Hoeflea sp.]